MKPISQLWRRLRRSPASVVAAVTLVALTVIIAWSVLPQSVSLEVGQLAKRDIDAPRTIVNRPATERLQEEARRILRQERAQRSRELRDKPRYAYMAEEAVRWPTPCTRLGTMPAPGRLRPRWKGSLQWAGSNPMNLTEAELTALARIEPSQLDAARQIAVSLTASTMRNVRISEDNLQQVRAGVTDDLTRLGLAPEWNAAVTAVVSKAISPNLALDLARVERAAAEEADRVQPVYVLKGQNIIRRGDVADADQIAILEDLGLLGAGRNVMGWFSVAGLVGMGMRWAHTAGHSPDASLSTPEFWRWWPSRARWCSWLRACSPAWFRPSLPRSWCRRPSPPWWCRPWCRWSPSRSTYPFRCWSASCWGQRVPHAGQPGGWCRRAHSVSGLKDRVSMTRAVAYIGVAMSLASVAYGLVTRDGRGHDGLVCRLGQWYNIHRDDPRFPPFSRRCSA